MRANDSSNPACPECSRQTYQGRVRLDLDNLEGERGGGHPLPPRRSQTRFKRFESFTGGLSVRRPSAAGLGRGTRVATGTHQRSFRQDGFRLEGLAGSACESKSTQTPADGRKRGSGQGKAPQYEADYHDANDQKDRSRKPIHGGSPVREYGQGPGCGTKVTEGSGPFPAVPKRPLKF
jgi:hypothetical protein